MKKLASLVMAGLMSFGAATVSFAADYKFVMVSHIGSNDANMKWLTLSLKAFEERYPEVETEYVSTNEYSIQKHLQLIEQVIATKPDGIAVPIASAKAFEPVLKKAIDSGIPVVAFNIPDARPVGERIPYLTYVGGDEYKTGYALGQQALAEAEAGKIPKLKQVVCAIHDAGHDGLKARCKGMSDAMKASGVKVENLFIGAEPAKARNTLQAYLTRNKSVNLIFTVAPFSAPWAYTVASDMGLSPDVDKKGVTIMTVDASPIAIEGIRSGKLLATNSQGFWLQGFVPMEWLYWNKKFGLYPSSDILTGPVVITPETADEWAKQVKSIFGDAYEEQASVW